MIKKMSSLSVLQKMSRVGILVFDAKFAHQSQSLFFLLLYRLF